ncbi:hypothetical protein [Neorhizobium alkalisoli]|uniref:hypothetical protein n=1 Tax=Neorhizobium alkalisoli TaxID=528178 RepID=UPI000CFA4E48|nr:hypothetical protein [Neorhizobium alkalisoli]
MNALDKTIFPQPRSGFVRAKRAAVIFRPIIGSVEQLVIGAIAYDGQSAHLARANRLNRLQCFYDDHATGAILAIELALEELALDLAADPILASGEYLAAMSGIAIGPSHDAEGVSLEIIASSWLAGMSSVYVPEISNGALVKLAIAGRDLEEPQAFDRASDRLGQLLLNYVGEKQPKLIDAFSEEIRVQARRRRGSAHSVFIDFAGSKIVANFGILSTSGYAASIDRIKRRMWDLKISRDDERAGFFGRNHEMLVQHPPENDPQLAQRQVDKIMESIRELERQADQEEIRFRPMTTVEQIGDHLMKSEAA